MSSVVVTGLGFIGACGSGAQDLRKALADADAAGAALTEVDRSEGLHLRRAPHHALLVDAQAIRPWLSPVESRRMSPPSKLAVAAARMALREAGFADGLPDQTTSVAVGTAFGPSSFSAALVRQILFESPETASPFLFTESVANAPAAQIAIAARARGANSTICQREASALLALGQAAAEIGSGRVQRALAGAVDEMTPLVHALLDRFGALARERMPNGREIARPLDRRRSGFVAAEGASVLVLESEASAAGRGAPVLARVLAWGSAFDPTAPALGWGAGHVALGRSLRRTVERAGSSMDRIDRVVVGASGAVDGDRLEARMVRAAFGERSLPAVLAPKAVTGEYGGGFLGAAALAATGAPFGPAPGFELADPDLGVVPHDGSALPAPRCVLVTSAAAGGAAAWVLLGAP